MDPAYISAFSGLAGAAIGGFASFSTSWATQRAQIRYSHSGQSARDWRHCTALVGRMHLVSSLEVVAAAEQIILGIIATYQGPNLALHEMHEYIRQGRMDYLVGFGEAAGPTWSAAQPKVSAPDAAGV